MCDKVMVLNMLNQLGWLPLWALIVVLHTRWAIVLSYRHLLRLLDWLHIGQLHDHIWLLVDWPWLSYLSEFLQLIVILVRIILDVTISLRQPVDPVLQQFLLLLCGQVLKIRVRRGCWQPLNLYGCLGRRWFLGQRLLKLCIVKEDRVVIPEVWIVLGRLQHLLYALV